MLGPGDTVVLPAGAERQVSARTDAQLIVCGRGDAVVRVPGEAAPREPRPGSADALANALRVEQRLRCGPGGAGVLHGAATAFPT